MRKLPTIASRQNSVNQYFGIQIHIVVVLFDAVGFCLAYFVFYVGMLSVLFGILGVCLAYLVFCLAYLLFCLEYLVFVWRTWFLFGVLGVWPTWCFVWCTL